MGNNAIFIKGDHTAHFLVRMWFILAGIMSCFPSAYPAERIEYKFVTVDITGGLSNNTVNAIYKDRRGFVWLGTQMGLSRFDGITVVNYPSLKDYSVYAICETDSVSLWIGTDKGLICLDRKTEKTALLLSGDQPSFVRALFTLAANKFLIITEQGLFIYENEKIEKVIFESNALSSINNLTGIIRGQKDNTFWITSLNGLIYYDLNTKHSKVYKFPSGDEAMNAFICLAGAGQKIYVGCRSRGIVVFDISSQTFSAFPYKGNPNIKTLSIAGESELHVGTNGGGLLTISRETGEITGVIEHDPDKGGSISSNAVYSFLKDGEIYWIGTYMGGVNYNPQYAHRFRLYAYGDRMDSRKYNVRSFRISEDGRKIIGTRNDGLIYISEKENIIKRFTTQTSVLRTNLILSVYPLNDKDFLVGTYGGGLYRFDSSTATLHYFHEDRYFNENSFPCFLKDKSGNLWIGSSAGVCVYDAKTNHYTLYNNANSALIHSSVFSMTLDSHDRIWFGTSGAVYFYDFSTGRFHSDAFPDPVRAYTRSVRCIYEDLDKNLWFCDDKEGVLKVDEHFTRFDHLTDADFLPCNSVTSIIEDETGGMWFASQKGLVCRGKEGVKFYSLYDGIPGYVFNTAVQKTGDGTLWWSNEQGLVYYNPSKTSAELQPETLFPLPAIVAISVSGKTLSTGDKLMLYAPAFTSKMDIVAGSSIEFAFSALNYSPLNASIYEYCLEGYDKGWQALTAVNKVSYTHLSRGNYLFKVRFASRTDLITSVHVNVYREIPLMAWIIIACTAFLLLLLFFYSRLLARYQEIKKHLADGNILKEKYLKSRMSDGEVEQIRKKLSEYMQKEKPYLNPDLKLADVAHSIGCASVDISQVLNIHLDANFTDFINQYRVDEFITRVQEASAARYTLASLSEQCGFSSRTSFFRLFKKIKGKTPAEFVREMGIVLHK